MSVLSLLKIWGQSLNTRLVVIVHKVPVPISLFHLTPETIFIKIEENDRHIMRQSRKRSYPEDFWSGCTEKNLKLYDEKTRLKVKLVKKDGEAWLHCHRDMKEGK